MFWSNSVIWLWLVKQLITNTKCTITAECIAAINVTQPAVGDRIILSLLHDFVRM